MITAVALKCSVILLFCHSRLHISSKAFFGHKIFRLEALMFVFKRGCFLILVHKILVTFFKRGCLLVPVFHMDVNIYSK